MKGADALAAVKREAVAHGDTKLALDALVLESPAAPGPRAVAHVVAVRRLGELLAAFANDCAARVDGADAAEVAEDARTLEDLADAARQVAHALRRAAGRAPRG